MKTRELNLRVRDFSILTDAQLNQLAVVFEMTKAELVRRALEDFVEAHREKLTVTTP